MESKTAGSPTDIKVKWTDLSPATIVKLYSKQFGEKISHSLVKRVLRSNSYCRRKPLKVICTGSSVYRDEQFKILTFLVGHFWKMENNPIISIDTKKKNYWVC